MNLPDIDSNPWDRDVDICPDCRSDEPCDCRSDDNQDAEEDIEAGDCGLCGGPLMLLGVLGKLAHFRCRNCGMMSSGGTE